MTPPLVHWDDVPPTTRANGHISGRWTPLGAAAGAVAVGLNRIQIAPGMWSTPAHAHGREEEIFVVLAGSGVSWQVSPWGGADAQTYAVEAGDVLVHRARGDAHTLCAGDDGLTVLAFGPRLDDEACFLPRAGVSWLGASWTDAGGEHPWAREAAIGPPELTEPVERPPTIVATREVEWQERVGATIARRRADLGRAAGSVTTGLKRYDVRPGMLSAPPHCHSAEEELFVVLEGDGVLILGDEEHAVRPGHVVARPAGTGVAHVFRAGDAGLGFLAYGTREPNDICFYPRSNKIFFGGVGVIARLEALDYWDGED
jgi:uncharacterized cupin superfamily protein